MISLRTAAAALLLLALAACTGRPEGVEVVRGFDATRYVGRWYEIMRLDHRFERGLTNVTATYTLRPDGKIAVVNRGFDPRTCRWKDVEGSAVFQDSPDIASLSVTFFWPFAGGYHVVELDRQDYGWALISGPTRDYLWILARRPELDPALRARLVARARDLGFPVDELILVDHRPQACTPSS